MTTDALLSVEEILDALATAAARRTLPRVAMQQAVERWDEVGPVLLALLEEAAQDGDASERTCEILCPAIFLMAQLRDTRALRPLSRLGLDGDLLEDVLGDAITEDLHMILARLYDGDQAPLRSLIEAVDADEFARDAALGAMVWLTAIGRIERDETARYLRDLSAMLQTQAPCFVWHGWQRGIARLGLEELVPLVEEAFAREWVDPSWLELADFRTDLRAALQAAEPTAMFDDCNDARYDDIASYLSDWNTFRPEVPSAPIRQPALPNLPWSETVFPRGTAMPGSRPAAPDFATTAGMGSGEPVRNPYRHVGRNDPCPCGSGKKFKKCCLETVR
jgi:hypothetical protein